MLGPPACESIFAAATCRLLVAATRRYCGKSSEPEHGSPTTAPSTVRAAARRTYTDSRNEQCGTAAYIVGLGLLISPGERTSPVERLNTSRWACPLRRRGLRWGFHRPRGL